MLDSLYIKNYRNLRELKIPTLGRVNLIIGKNNTGKSSVLEAVSIYATLGDLSHIYRLLTDRGESYNDASKDIIENNIKSFSSIFHKRIYSLESTDSIAIGSIESTLSGDNISSTDFVSIRFVNYIEEKERNGQGLAIVARKIVESNNLDQPFDSYKLGLEVQAGMESYLRPLDRDGLPFRYKNQQQELHTIQFISSRTIDQSINSRLWDQITLTPDEDLVVNALKIVDPDIVRINFTGPSGKERFPMALDSHANRYPLRSMGDGINRILTIILALVNAKNGFLLIDEFENGLHHSVQTQLWEIIFVLAEKFNVQVFATTHSEDCIKSFEHILNQDSHQNLGKLIRLDNINGVIQQVEFNAEELAIVTENNIEIR